MSAHPRALRYWRYLCTAILFGLFQYIPTFSQNFRNEWIDYSKTYYRFPVAPVVVPGVSANNHHDAGDYNGVRRIPYSTLQAAGLGSADAEHLQLWRNGKQVPIYVWPETGTLSTGAFIEFWGEANDGLEDSVLYRQRSHQQNNRWSLFNDTAFFYLTINPAGPNLRLINATHDPLNSSVAPTTWITHTVQINHRGSRNLGYSVSIDGKDVRSSSFDPGEGWGETRTGNSNLQINLSRLYPARTVGQNMSFSFSAMGYTQSSRIIQALLNGVNVGQKTFSRLNLDSVTTNNINISTIHLTNDSLNIRFQLSASNASDRFYIAKSRLTYPRLLQFNKTTSRFKFQLPASAQPQLLKLVDFDTTQSANKFLLDLTNLKRYQAVRQADTLWVELEPSATARSLVLYTNQVTAGKVQEISTLTQRQFLNLALAANQGNYLIISHPDLTNDNGTNQIEAYRAYRASSMGGNFNAKTYLIGELAEQFAYGIERSPLSISNFIRYAVANFTDVKHVFLIGRGVTYDLATNNANYTKLHFLPTWGQPASDNQLAAPNPNTTVPAVSIGRLAAITGAEVKDYLIKVQALEALQQNPNADNSWQKQTLHLIGGNDDRIVPLLQTYMDDYKRIISDTLVGANVATFMRLNDPNASANQKKIIERITAGVGLISYYGHSSATSFDFNLNNPEELGNSGGLLPVFMANGCNASEFFDLSTQRLNQLQLTLSERFVLAKDGGSIAFLSSTHYGVLQYLNNFARNWYKAVSYLNYSQPLGTIHKTALQLMRNESILSDYYARLTAEEYHLHGDPAIVMYSLSKPDFIMDSSYISLPENINLNNDSVLVKVKYFNQGKAILDTITVRITRTLPNGSVQTLYQAKQKAPGFEGNVTTRFAVRGLDEAGLNTLHIAIDTDDDVEEVNENNNEATYSFTIADQGVKPVYPLPFAIVNEWPITLWGNTVDPVAPPANYTLQVDTTAQFNSSALWSVAITNTTGLMSGQPTFTPTDGRTYYWRFIKEGGAPSNYPWNSFTYLPTETNGFNTQHYYQLAQSKFTSLLLDSTSRRLLFVPKENNLYITHGIYPTSATEDLHLSITMNGVSPIYSASVGRSIIFNVFDPISFKPWLNTTGRFGSGINAGAGREFNFEFQYYPASNRKKMMDFLDSIPTGHFVTARLVLDPDPGQPSFVNGGKADSAYAQYWKRDTTLYGSGKSLYHKLVQQGFAELDSMNTRRTFSFAFRKNDPVSFTPSYVLSEGLYDRPILSVDLPMQDTTGKLQTTILGPALRWDALRWLPLPASGSFDAAKDSARVLIMGSNNKQEWDTIKLVNKTQLWYPFTGADTIKASDYQYLKLELLTDDPLQGTPFPLDYLRVNYLPAPEGALSSNDYFEWPKLPNNAYKDTFNNTVPDTIKLGIAFKNISSATFTDSLKVQAFMEDETGNRQVLNVGNIKPLAGGDTAHINLAALVDGWPVGSYKLYLAVNPGLQVPEQDFANNFLYRSLYITDVLATPTNVKTFNGTGQWSDASKWTPAGVPACTDKVFINGNCTVDVTDAVADSLTINAGARLLLQPNTQLRLGCQTNGGGNKLLKVLGALELQGGTLFINGGLFFANASSFIQTDGEIWIDPNDGNAATSLQLDEAATDGTMPPAVLAFGGTQTTTDHWLQPLQTFTLQATGGKIVIIDPPQSETGYAMSLAALNNLELHFGTGHTLQIGSSTETSPHNSLGMGFRIVSISTGLPQLFALGNMAVQTGDAAGRLCNITWPAEQQFLILGQIQVAENATLQVGAGTTLVQGQQ